MFTVALVGGDGAGKTTIAKNLESSRLRIKYLYMGVSTRSSNRALPTSRLVLFLKRRSYKNRLGESDKTRSGDIPANELEYGEAEHGSIWAFARFLNRLAEAWYRQSVAFIYEMQGYVVIFDRHFFFDSAPDIINSDAQKQHRLDRLFHWLMSYCYPRPDLAIFLDAPGELLYERKREASPDYLNRQRKAFIEQGKKLRNFVRVDATQPLNQVLAEVTQRIMDFSVSGHHGETGDDSCRVLNDKQSS